MKYNKYIFWSAILLALVISILPCLAIDVVLDGKKLKMETEPILRNEMVFVPLRGIFEKMGATVSFDPTKNMITAVKGKKTITLSLGHKNPKINALKSRALQAPIEIKGRTFVPLRYIGESLNCRVSWHPPTKTVAISSNPAKDPLEDFKDDDKDNLGDGKIMSNIKGIQKIDPKKKDDSKKKDKEKDEDEIKEDDIEKEINIE